MLRLEEEIRRLEENGVDMLHFDVMDGVFVNNITYGLPVLAAIRRITKMTLDVHLMITQPHRYVQRFADSGADIISFHLESGSDPINTINMIKNAGSKAALAIKPATPAEELYPYLPYIDMALVMTVEPGFGGQKFIPETVDKVKLIRDKINSLSVSCDVEVDGGINDETSVYVKKAGANVLVSGSFLFKADDMRSTAELIKEDILC